MGERLKRACIAMAKCWGLALASVLIPILHFILVPGFLIAGFVLFFIVLNVEFLFVKTPSPGFHEIAYDTKNEKVAELFWSEEPSSSLRVKLQIWKPGLKEFDKKLVSHLEQTTLKKKCMAVRIETQNLSDEQIARYESHGFVRIDGADLKKIV